MLYTVSLLKTKWKNQPTLIYCSDAELEVGMFCIVEIKKTLCVAIIIEKIVEREQLSFIAKKIVKCLDMNLPTQFIEKLFELSIKNVDSFKTIFNQYFPINIENDFQYFVDNKEVGYTVFSKQDPSSCDSINIDIKNIEYSTSKNLANVKEQLKILKIDDFNEMLNQIDEARMFNKTANILIYFSNSFVLQSFKRYLETYNYNVVIFNSFSKSYFSKLLKIEKQQNIILATYDVLFFYDLKINYIYLNGFDYIKLFPNKILPLDLMGELSKEINNIDEADIFQDRRIRKISDLTCDAGVELLFLEKSFSVYKQQASMFLHNSPNKKALQKYLCKEINKLIIDYQSLNDLNIYNETRITLNLAFINVKTNLYLSQIKERVLIIIKYILRNTNDEFQLDLIDPKNILNQDYELKYRYSYELLITHMNSNSLSIHVRDLYLELKTLETDFMIIKAPVAKQDKYSALQKEQIIITFYNKEYMNAYYKMVKIIKKYEQYGYKFSLKQSSPLIF